MNRKRILGAFCLVLGAALLLSALGLFLHNRQESARAGQAADEVVMKLQLRLDTGTLPAETDDLSAPVPEEPTAPASTDPTETTGPVPALTAVSIDGHDYVGYLEIPSLERKLPVMKLAYLEDLQISPCLQYGSPFTDDAVIAAHNYPAHFGPLRDFTGGETIRFTDMNGETIDYTVALVKTIEPTAVREATGGDYDLVLYTCTTGGQARVMLGCDRTP